MRPILISISLIVVAAAAVYVGVRLLSNPSPSTAMLVDDRAGLFAEAERLYLAEYHRFLLADHDIDYRVITDDDTGDIDSFANQKFAEWDVGGRSGIARGLLLVVDPASDRVRLEVGHALEGVFPDAFIAYVEQRQMVPFFRVGRAADGILATTELIITRAQRAAANAGFDGELWPAGSGGAGAATDAQLGAGPAPRSSGAPGRRGATPAATLALYLAAMDARDDNPDLAIYTPETRAMLKDWVFTPAQMDNVVKAYRGCAPEAVRFSAALDRAVIRYPPAQRQCAPWFFARLDDGWALDLTMMQKAIRFGRTNAWRFDMTADHDYRFGFADWTFDRNGFPVDTAN